jgi:hypothetical protein
VRFTVLPLRLIWTTEVTGSDLDSTGLGGVFFTEPDALRGEAPLLFPSFAVDTNRPSADLMGLGRSGISTGTVLGGRPRPRFRGGEACEGEEPFGRRPRFRSEDLDSFDNTAPSASLEGRPRFRVI